MKEVDAIELAHHVKELLSTRAVIRKLEEGFVDVVIPEYVKLSIRDEVGDIVSIAIPPHVMRQLVADGSLLSACKVLEQIHEQTIKDMVGITVEKG